MGGVAGGGRGHLTLNSGHPIGHPGLTPTTHATTVSQLSLLPACGTFPPLRHNQTKRCTHILSGSQYSSQGETGCAGSLQSPKEQGVRHGLPASTAATATTTVSTAYHPPNRGGRGASSCWRRGPRSVQRGTVGGWGALLA